MVDLDDTMVSFSEMFINRLNSIISTGFYPISKKRFTIDDFQSYSIVDLFKDTIDSRRTDIEYICRKICNEIFSDVSFYKNPILTIEFPRIIEIIQQYKDECKVILNTKVSSMEMVISKANLFKELELTNLFDEIIIDYEKGEHSPKLTTYDIMIDDAPHNIEQYLKENDNGIIYMPLRPWNKQFKDNPRINIL